ncbi:MAG: DUF6263 family protein [bacterium]
MKKVIMGLLFLTIFVTGCMPKNTVKLEYRYNQGEVLKQKITLINTFVLDVNLPTILSNAPVAPSTKTVTVSPSEGTMTTQEAAPMPPALNKRYEISTRLELLCIKSVKSITPDGIITLEERFEPLSEEILINKESTLLEGCSVSDILRGKTLILRVTTNGSILSTEGTDELLEDVYRRTSLLGMDEASRSRIGDVLRYEIEQLIQQSISMFPGEKLTKGDTWKRQTISSLPIMGIKTTITQTNMFEGFEIIKGSDCAKITGSITSTISNEKPELSALIGGELANKITQQGLTVEMMVNGAERGTTMTCFAHKEGKIMKNQILKEGFVNVTAPLMMGSVTSGAIEVKMTTNSKYIVEKYKE